MYKNQRWFQFRNGDHDAFEEIYREQIDSLLSYGKKFSDDQTLVEDAIQDLFIDMWKKRESLGDTDNIRGYLLLSLRRSIFKKLKKQSKYISEEQVDVGYFKTELAIDQLIINEEIDEEKAAKINLAMSNLPDRQKELIYLKYYEGLEYNVIGEMMGLNYQSVRNLASRAIATLKRTILLWIVTFIWF